jgi:hypothetical protein
MIHRLILLSTQPFCRGIALQSACSGPRAANCIDLVYKDPVRLSSLVHVSGNLRNIGFLVRNENVSVIYKIRCKRTKDSVYVSPIYDDPICDVVTKFVTNAVIGCILQSGNNVERSFPPFYLRQYLSCDSFLINYMNWQTQNEAGNYVTGVLLFTA